MSAKLPNFWLSVCKFQATNTADSKLQSCQLLVGHWTHSRFLFLPREVAVKCSCDLKMFSCSILECNQVVLFRVTLNNTIILCWLLNWQSLPRVILELQIFI